MAGSGLEFIIAADASPFERTMGKVARKSKETTAMIGAGWKAAAAVAAAAFGGAFLTRMAADWARMAGVQQKAVAGMEQALRSMGRYTPQLSMELQNLASAIQQQTTYGDEMILQGQKMLLTYKQIGDDVMPRATRAMVDLAALTGGDMAASAKILGQAAMGLTGQLARYGITLSDTAKKGKDFSVILAEIESQVGGQAAALALTGIGPWEQLNNQWGDAKETLGELALVIGNEFLPALTRMVNEVSRLAEATNKMMSGDMSFFQWLSGMTPDWKAAQGQRRQSLAMRMGGAPIAGGTGGADIAGLAGAQAAMGGGAGGPPTGSSGLTDQQKKWIEDSQAWQQERALTHEERMLGIKHGAAEAEVIAFYEHKALMLGGESDHENARLAVIQESNRAEVELQKRKEKQLLQLRRTAQTATVDNFIKAGKLLLGSAAKDNDALFWIVQGAAAGRAAMSTGVAVMEALANPPGPPWSIPLAASIAAFGAAQVASILSQSPAAGGGVSAGVPAVSATTAPVVDVASPTASSLDDTGRAAITNIYIDAISDLHPETIDLLVDEINKAGDREVMIHEVKSAREIR